MDRLTTDEIEILQELVGEERDCHEENSVTYNTLSTIQEKLHNMWLSSGE